MKKIITLFLFFNIAFFSLGQETETIPDSSFMRIRSHVHIQSVGIFDPLRISINKIHELRVF